ncbi:MAG: hypothetical protein PHH12_03665 [Candidatus Shapirobacteria bacterium]|nr:hypothetical protein [Candidatus Shapirobacteria bacterium]
MEENNKKTDYIGNIIVFILLGLLLYAGYLSYKSIDWNVLKNLESESLILPTPIPATPSATIAPTSTATSPATKNN